MVSPSNQAPTGGFRDAVSAGAPFDGLRAMCTQSHVVTADWDNRFYSHPFVFDGDTLDH